MVEKEREIAEHELIKAQMLLSSAITQNVSGIIVAENPDAKIQLVNAAALEILGIEDENIIFRLIKRTIRVIA